MNPREWFVPMFIGAAVIGFMAYPSVVGMFAFAIVGATLAGIGCAIAETLKTQES